MHFLLHLDPKSATNIKISNMHAPSFLLAAHAFTARNLKHTWQNEIKLENWESGG